MNIREIIQEIVGPKGNENLFATVVDVDSSAKTCTVKTLNDEMDIFDVRLIADSGDGLLYIPVVNSVVGVSMINEIEGFISLYSQISSVKIGDGANGGLIKVSDLVTKINNIESDLNDLKTVFSTTWVVAALDGGAALKAAAAAWAGATLTPTVDADIENTTITHGDL